MKGPLAGRALPKHAEGCPHRSGRKKREPVNGEWWQTTAKWKQIPGMPCIVSRVTDDEVQFMMKHNSTEFVLPREQFFDRFERMPPMPLQTYTPQKTVVMCPYCDGPLNAHPMIEASYHCPDHNIQLDADDVVAIVEGDYEP